ncbi:flagellar biosynthesis protein FliQ [Paludicola sp. MB14-C6]|uniref:flagellar biosynthesis protein FliQ n=1 Tax=Paludihabitans sp. MB14-C6 TaxID=3070656 RepID=UPI0027DD6B0C|nr:flagellar biosynthesis protein FliQ [Paludicola sp. MB14-C6]WMJ24235.1 flagellar biosynthesis protein FliQ [Paludicola sp. MB14-C6]
MSTNEVMSVLQQAMLVAIKVAAPILVISILIGLVISIFQAATQIHEQTLTFVPKLLAIALILILLGPWMIETMMDFTVYIFDSALKLI